MKERKQNKTIILLVLNGITVWSTERKIQLLSSIWIGILVFRSKKWTNAIKSAWIVWRQIRGIAMHTFTDSHESSSSHTHSEHASIQNKQQQQQLTIIMRIFSLSLCNQFAFACQLTAFTAITHQWWHTVCMFHIETWCHTLIAMFSTIIHHKQHNIRFLRIYSSALVSFFSFAKWKLLYICQNASNIIPMTMMMMTTTIGKSKSRLTENKRKSQNIAAYTMHTSYNITSKYKKNWMTNLAWLIVGPPQWAHGTRCECAQEK